MAIGVGRGRLSGVVCFYVVLLLAQRGGVAGAVIKHFFCGTEIAKPVLSC